MRCLRPRSSFAALPLALLLGPLPAVAQDNPPGKPQSPGTAKSAETIRVEGPARAAKTGYVQRDSNAATRTETKLIDVPASVSTVTRDQMTVQDVQSINQTLAYSSGIATSQRGGDAGRYDQLTIRGFMANSSNGSTDQFLDGLPLLGGAYYAAQQVDPFLLEEVDVLKGPSSVLYGDASPGGVIAETSKLPTANLVDSFLVEGGTYRTARGVFDLGGPVGDGTVTYRFTGTGLTADGQQFGTRIRHYALAPALAWAIDDRTTLTLLGRYQRDPALGAYSSAPSVGTVLYNPLGTLQNDFYNGDYSDEIFNRTQSSINAILDRQLAPGWEFQATTRYTAVGAVDQGVYGDELAPGSFSVLPRFTYGSKENVDIVTFLSQLTGHVATGPVRHEVLIGVADQSERDHYDYGGGNAPPLDIFAPVYGQSIAHPAVSLDDGQTFTDTGLFLQDQATLGHWHVTVGGREDWSEIDTRNHLTGSNGDQPDRAFTFRGGILYAFSNGISPYFNYAQSFQPNTGTDHDNNPFAATRGEQYEIGTKYQPRGFASFMTAALYDLTESNVLVADPVYPGFSIATGSIRSRGIELEAHASLADGLDLIGAYTYQDVNYLGDSGTLSGKRAGQVPAQFGSVWVHYTRRTGRLAGLGGGVGVRYVGDTNVLDTYGDAREFTTPSYALVDLEVEYDLWHAFPALKHVNLAVNATNLGNERYVASCYAGLGCFLGANRTVIGRLGYKW